MEEEGFSVAEKKRRLSVGQVKTLERKFEEENKLEPERKARIAEETGLHPRQVAVWFQNRRARWKTKQLERDYCVLKVHYDSLNLDYNNLQHERQVLTSKLEELRAKVREECREEEHSMSHTEQKLENKEGSNKFLQILVPTYHDSWCSLSSSGSKAETCWFGNYPEKEINMVDLEEHCYLNSEECARNL